MMEKILALYDQDVQYMERLRKFLRNRAEVPFQLHTFQSLDKLGDFSRKKEIDILLYTKEEDLDSIRRIPAKKLVFLSDGEGDAGAAPGRGQENLIYKFQSGDSIVRELMGYYGDIPAFTPGRRDGKAELYMVFSPIGRSGKTRFALSLAKALSEDRKALLVSLEETAWFPSLFHVPQRGSLTEMLYYYKEGSLDAMKLRSLCYASDGLDYVPPIRNPEDLSVLTDKELSGFLEVLAANSGYDAIVLDTDSIVSRFSSFFPLCKRVFIPVREDTASLRKLSGFERFLDQGASPPQDRFVKLSLPAPPDPAAAGSVKTYLDEGVLAFASAVVQNYIL